MRGQAPMMAKEDVPASPMPVQIGLLDFKREEELCRWDAYVDKHGAGSFFHCSGWLCAVRDHHGYEIFPLVAQNSEDEILALLPLVAINSPLFGRSLISSAFSVGGGIVSDNLKAMAMLAKRAALMAAQQKAAYVELRGGEKPDGWVSKSKTYAGFVNKILPNAEEALLAIPRKKRADIRKTIKAEAAGQLEFIEQARVDDVYSLYACSLRNLGTPVFSIGWLRALAKNFSSDRVSFSLVKANAKPVAGLVSFWHKNKVMPYYVGALPQARELHAYDYLYWKLMEMARKRGVSDFDFGRSKYDTGSFAYKTYWGFQPTPLFYHYHLGGGQKIPDINPNNPKFNLATKVWKKLPLSMANILGPIVERHLA